MKKIILSAAILAVAGLATVKASSIVKHPVTITVQQDTSQKTPVKLEALPDPVKATLKDDAFKEWIPVSAADVKSGAVEYFEITVKKGTEIRAVKIGPDGKIIQ
jgi:hypothetical protein